MLIYVSVLSPLLTPHRCTAAHERDPEQVLRKSFINLPEHLQSSPILNLAWLFSSPDFSQAFYCEAAMPGIDCVTLGLDAQHTASTYARPNCRAPYHCMRPLYESCEKSGLAQRFFAAFVLNNLH